jgi:hypothetical protein
VTAAASRLLAAGRRREIAFVALAVGGTTFALIQVLVGTQAGLLPIPPGDTLIWDRVGDQLRAGEPVYVNATPLTDSFWYAPPWAVAFAAVSWMPPPVLHLGLVVVKVASLRVIAGSWLGVGVAAWFPLVAIDVASGSFNLLIAAAIVAAVRGRPQLAVVAALAKLGPLLSVDPRQWRLMAPILALCVVVTIPWLSLWPEWVDHLARNAASPLGPQVPIPGPVRWLAAIGLLAARRPWARALAGTIAIPAFYWGSLVILIAPVAVFVRERFESEQRELFAA